MFTKTTILSAALLALGARAQHDGPAEGLNPNPKDTSNPRLVGKLFPPNQIPYQADTSNGDRGPQFGYNLCNSTTAGQDSKCQTFIFNDIGDFCLPAPPKRGTVGDTEDQGVAWCTKKTHGARLIPAGALTAVQYIRTPSYVAITGYINQELINIPANDDGGEYDSGGQDNRGNPIGALVYSNSLTATNGTLTQARMWHAFMGSGVFCMKACSDTAPNASGLCRHIYDTYGCEVNVPNSYQENVFLSCQGEDQDPVLPGHSRIPASSNCVTYTSSKLYTDLVSTAQPSATPPSSSSTSASASSTATQSSKPTSTPVGTGAGGGGASSSSSKPVTPVSLPTTTSQSSASEQTSAPPDGAPSRVPISGTAIVLGALGLVFGAVFA